jgi:hypothetical protein
MNMGVDNAAAERSIVGPAWRSKLVEQLPGRRSHRFVRACDEDVRRLHHYRQLCGSGAAGMQQALALYPKIASAEELNGSDKLDLLKVAVLAGLDGREIARRLGSEEAVVDAWEKIYFDVRGMREAVSWIHFRVIVPERTAGREDLAARLKFVAAVGASGARAVLDLDTRAPLDEGQRLFDRRLKLFLKAEVAAEAPVQSDREKMFFLRTYADMQLQENRLRLQEQKIQQRCRADLEKQELAKIRLEFAHQRAERNAAARDRRERERRLIREAKAKLWRSEAARRKAMHMAEAARATVGPLAQLRWHKGAVDTSMSVSTLPLCPCSTTTSPQTCC